MIHCPLTNSTSVSSGMLILSHTTTMKISVACTKMSTPLVCAVVAWGHMPLVILSVAAYFFYVKVVAC
jgi:hypothetical protein